jgi:hypothetical protein
MVENIMYNDDETKKLLVINKFNEIYQQSEQNIDDITTKFQQDVKILHREKVRTVSYCEKVLVDAQRNAERKSITLVDAYKSFQKKKYRMLDELEK